ncbi:MAG: allantoin permease [Sulfobacillus benefaciens]|uniref:Allantoin permease n=1 Tax=Sulfobacillus benefaciens TaxID=453960 RepID=A0A2T2XJR7_9FIRM|nr:MAG: allantoin permease [Sulfobacillus benefaciens]
MALNPKYGTTVLKVEPFGVEPVASRERHGRPRSQFTLWLGSNLTIADYALGFFPISLGMPWGWTVAAILVGNLVGAWVLALCAAMGPSYGLPQLMISKRIFGRRAGYLPALLNYVSTIGWFSVNNILGSFGLRVLWPHLPFYQAALILVFIQGLIAIYGHNLIHAYERIMSVVLGILFLVVTISLIGRPSLGSYHPAVHNPWVLFAIMVAAAFSYVGSWGPYASDYSRYLPSQTSRRSIMVWSFLGAFIASAWLELVGAAVAVVAGPEASNPIAALHSVTGALGGISVIAIILGGTAADALNLYSNALSAGALDLRLPRWSLAALASLIGLGLSLAGSGSFEQYYDNFLLLLGYWMTPWMGVMFADFYLRQVHFRTLEATPKAWRALVSFIVGFMVSIPFMSSTLFTGPIAHKLGGADLTFYVGFFVAMTLYLLWSRPGIETAGSGANQGSHP